MIDVVSIKFKNRGKSYYFDPNGLSVHTGEMVIVETSKGLEIAECSRANHPVEENAVVQPLRPVVRVATQDDLRIAQINRQREKEAMQICQQRVAEHGLDMKLVDVECNFEGNKITFFFTSDGRVDFRELVKDLAGIFRSRIELRQIGVRDEAKLLGGIGICGRPYCCNQFLEDFQPVSTKMAKVQSLSLNPAKISGSCGRLMCCLRYEQEAYEDLVKKVPKQGAFVETKDGFGNAVQVNLLRQTVKVKLDSDTDDNLHLYKSNELCTVPGGRPKDGSAPVSTLQYVPEPEEEEPAPELLWEVPQMVVPDNVSESTQEKENRPRSRSRNRHRGGKGKDSGEAKTAEVRNADGQRRSEQPRAPRPQKEKKEKKGERSAEKPIEKSAEKPNRGKKATVKPVRLEQKGEARSASPKPDLPAEKKPVPQNAESGEQTKKSSNNRRRHYPRRKSAPKSGGQE